MAEKKITIYSTPVCGYCKMTKQYLTDNHINYEDTDVSNDEAAAELMIKKSGQMGVPVIIIEQNGQEEIIVGFQKNKLAEILNIN
ncbi:NrdH-redoxin [Candidatus Kuenenbacteria bacterium CG10_big_fil_rev_8_21_14_0_10_36_11]|uniref:NrdH-redoxin n=1 Tax=Candidatus Kuenenbacteria bacterium CG10_big_fil_rev_8_21_14_0_10_36_11 TaxID=1974618 RepID=A0A2M6W9U6_9BACT|nr:MAG: NrdH-redoxin [Candidatus Kuenenbacteria bacterium CG10_big_fil_rev_8_21_14_0_10_36_11]